MAFVKLADNYTDLIGKFAVALLAEGVDRNQASRWKSPTPKTSPSSRRAWIEIITTTYTVTSEPGRPPRGGRG